jgi:hypothetical protein
MWEAVEWLAQFKNGGLVPGRGGAHHGPQLGERQLVQFECGADERQFRQRPGHAEISPSRAQRVAAAPAQPVRRRRPAVPPAQLVEHPEHSNQAIGHGMQMAREDGDPSLPQLSAMLAGEAPRVSMAGLFEAHRGAPVMCADIQHNG